MSNAVQSVGNDVTKAVNAVGDIGQAIINNPLPVIETVALTAALGPEGVGLASAIGAPATAAVSSAAVEAANGGSVKQIADAAAGGAVGSEVTSLVAPVTSPVQGAATGSVSPLASAAGGAAGGATTAALSGQDVGKGALTGGLVSGGAALGAQEVSSLTSPGPMSGTGLTVPTSNLPPVSDFDTSSQPSTGTPSLKLPGGISTLDQLAGYGGQEYTGGYTSPTTGEYVPLNTGLQYNLSQDVFTPGGVDYGFTQAKPTDTLLSEPQTTPGLSPQAQSALQSVFGFGIGTALAPKATGLGALNVSTTGSTASTPSTGTTSSTTGGAPGGTELDPSSGKAPQQVWGDKYTSLKEGLNV
jgi:hypothetical protein